jgi:hypothetical protein
LCFAGLVDALPNTEEESVAQTRFSMDSQYLDVISLVERLHRQFLEVVKLELEGFGIHDINKSYSRILVTA